MPNFVAILFAGMLILASTASPADDLLDIYKLAAVNDPVLQAAAANRLAVHQRKPQNRALLLPTVNLSASASKFDQNVLSGSSLLFAEDNVSYTVSLQQPLYHRDYFARLAQADAEIAGVEADYAAAEQDMMLRAAERYFNVLAAEDNLTFVLAEKNAIERQLEQTRQRFEVGLIAITDVHEAQAAYDLVLAQEIDAENQLASQREALHELTGQDTGSLAILGDNLPLPEPEPSNLSHWSDAAQEQNLELIAARQRTDFARRNLDISRAGHFPSLDFNASFDYSDSQGGSFGGDRETEDTTISLNLTLPLYAGGGTTAKVRESRYQLAQAKENYEQQRRQTLRQTRDAFRNVRAAIKRVKALQQAVISAQSALDATEAGLEVGTRTTVDVLDVRKNLFLAQRNFARARYDYILNTLRLKQSTGILAEKDIEQINRWLKERS